MAHRDVEWVAAVEWVVTNLKALEIEQVSVFSTDI
jgi:hypothetical protein